MIEKSKLKQKGTHGTALFPLCVYHNDVGYDKTILDCHWHDEIELIYLHQGKAVFHIDTDPVEISAGQAVFVNGKQLHAGYSSDNSYCIYYPIVFDLNMLGSRSYDICQEKFINPLLTGAYRLPAAIRDEAPWEREIILNLRRIISAYMAKEFSMELSIKASLYRILDVLFENARLETGNEELVVRGKKLDRLKHILKFIDENYQHKLSIEALSKLVNMNPQYFCRFFKQHTGRSPFDYINFLRIERSMDLILMSDLKLSAIALELGFDSPSYFISMFRRYKGCTPSKFRKDHSGCPE